MEYGAPLSSSSSSSSSSRSSPIIHLIFVFVALSRVSIYTTKFCLSENISVHSSKFFWSEHTVKFCPKIEQSFRLQLDRDFIEPLLYRVCLAE